MTNQEAFGRMCEHLMTQGCRAVGSEGGCRYRTDDGKMCPVGVLIPDDQYRPEMESCAARFLCNADIPNFFVPALKGLDGEMLEDVQNVHDETDIESWPSKLVAVAEIHGLVPPVCIQVPTTAPPNHTSTR